MTNKQTSKHTQTKQVSKPLEPIYHKASMTSSTDATSTEMPSALQPKYAPVEVKYVPLPNPVTATMPIATTITANESMRPPCRRCLQDAQIGDSMHLLAYDPFPVDSNTPYRGTSPIFIHANRCEFDGQGVPTTQLRRQMSVRAYDEKEFLVAAEVLDDGEKLKEVAGYMLADEKAKFVHVHNAKPGCFAFKIVRA